MTHYIIINAVTQDSRRLSARLHGYARFRGPIVPLRSVTVSVLVKSDQSSLKSKLLSALIWVESGVIQILKHQKLFSQLMKLFPNVSLKFVFL